MTDGGMHFKKFSIEGRVPSFRRGELSGEEGERLPSTMEDLFKDGVDGDVAGIGGKH